MSDKKTTQEELTSRPKRANTDNLGSSAETLQAHSKARLVFMSAAQGREEHAQGT